MTVEKLCGILGCTVVIGGESLKRKITGGYCGDMLSWVLGHAQAGSVWITVIGNVNAIAVAVLTDASCILLAEGVKLDKDAAKQAQQNGIAVLESSRTAYELAAAVYEAICDEHT